MKTLLFCLLTAMLYYSSSNNHAQPAVGPEPSAPDSSHKIIFETEIQPIFASHCMPCHFTGGKMYDRLPFDKPQTIVDHEAGILKRIKDEKETALIKQFIAQQKMRN